MLEIEILRNSSPKKLGVLRGAFLGFGCPKRHPDALLAKTMVQGTGSERSAGAPLRRGGSGGRLRPPEAKGSTCSEVHSKGYPASKIGNLRRSFDVFHSTSNDKTFEFFIF